MDQSEQTVLAMKDKKDYSGIPLRVMKMLGTGLLPVEVARALGISEGYISQLQAEPDFKAQVNELVTKTFAQHSEIDQNYIEIEKTLSDRLKQVSHSMYSPDQILRTLKFANEAKRKVAPSAQNPGTTGGQGNGVTFLQPVTLILPSSVAKEFVLSPTNEIVGIGDQPLNTLQSNALPNLVRKHKEESKLQELEKKQGFKILPNGSRQTDPWRDL